MADIVVGIYSAALLLLCAVGLYGARVLRTVPRRQEETLYVQPSLEALPTITVQVPVYNERFVIERLLHAICALDYPHDRIDIQILDDSTDETSTIIAAVVENYRGQGRTITHLQRTERKGYKAGALSEGLQKSAGEFIAIFDADFVPPSNFLLRAVSLFSHDRIGLVQARWGHLDATASLLTRAQALSLDTHFAGEQRYRYQTGRFLPFNGTAGLWRRSAILDAGGWHSDTLAEDVDLAYRAQMRGWHAVYVHDLVAPADVPPDMLSLKAQQFRWTKGGVQVARKLLTELWRSPFPLGVRVEATVHVLGALVFPVLLLVTLLQIPVVFAVREVVHTAPLLERMWVLLLAPVASVVVIALVQRSLYADWWRRLLYAPVFLIGSMGLAVSNARAVSEALMGVESPFIRTPKHGALLDAHVQAERYRVRASLWEPVLEITLALYAIAAIGVSVMLGIYSFIFFQATLALAFGVVGIISLRDVLRSA